MKPLVLSVAVMLGIAIATVSASAASNDRGDCIQAAKDAGLRGSAIRAAADRCMAERATTAKKNEKQKKH